MKALLHFSDTLAGEYYFCPDPYEMILPEWVFGMINSPLDKRVDGDYCSLHPEKYIFSTIFVMLEILSSDATMPVVKFLACLDLEPKFLVSGWKLT